MEAHGAAVHNIATSIQHFHKENRPWRVYHGGSNSTRQPRYSRNAVVDTSCLIHILKIDRETERALVEPNVSMGKLAAATFAVGLVPAVVMEFSAITVGGGFSGNSGESSSWKHGLFDETITSIEIILADGTITQASPKKNPDLYYGAAGGHGTLGLVTALEIQLLPAKKYIKIDCFPVSSTAEANKTMQRLFREDKHLYIDALLIGPCSGMIMAGHPIDGPGDSSQDSQSAAPPIVRFDRARDQWFYRYIEKRLASLPSAPSSLRSPPSHTFTFLTPTLSYLFRYDRGAFWGGKYAFRYLITPFNRITRFLLDPLLHSGTMFRALHGSGLAGETVVQDIGVPMRNLPAFMQYLGDNLGFEYWWLCPIRHSGRTISFARAKVKLAGEEAEKAEGTGQVDDIWVNVGIWGRGTKDPAVFASDNRKLEAKTHELGGLKALYARTYYTEDEFWKIYDREAYDELRRKYNATGLPSLYDKVKVEPMREEGPGLWWKIRQTRPLPGIWGIVSLLKREYLFAK